MMALISSKEASFIRFTLLKDVYKRQIYNAEIGGLSFTAHIGAYIIQVNLVDFRSRGTVSYTHLKSHSPRHPVIRIMPAANTSLSGASTAS